MRLATIALDGREVAAVVNPDGGYAPLPALGWPQHDLLDLLTAGLTPAVRDDLAARAGAAGPDDVLRPGRAVLRPLLRRPRKIIGIGLNYREHADDLAAVHPTSPVSFFKGDHTIVGPGEEIVVPPQSRRTTSEAELGLVIGRECRQVGEDEALDHVAGFFPVLDQTAEDILAENPRFLTRSKNFPTFLSLGAPLVTTDEVLQRHGDLGTIRVVTERERDGRVETRENVVANMTFGLAHLVSFHSQVMPLYPGDVISTGTPGALVVEDGDVVRCRIPGIGELVNRVRAG